MTEKHIITDLDADRADFTDPHRHRPHMERVKEHGAIDLWDNYTLEDIGGGYVRIVPIDETKRF